MFLDQKIEEVKRDTDHVSVDRSEQNAADAMRVHEWASSHDESSAKDDHVEADSKSNSKFSVHVSRANKRADDGKVEQADRSLKGPSNLANHIY